MNPPKGYHKDLFKNGKPIVKENDVISLKIFEEPNEPSENDFHLLCVVKEVNNKFVQFYDVQTFQEAYDTIEETTWSLNYPIFTDIQYGSYKYRKLGVVKDFPEYTL